MSNENRLVAAVRTEFGKGAARRTRRAGQIPAVLYGHGTDPKHLSLPGLEFAAVLRNHGTNAVLTLEVDGTEQLALTKSVTTHPIRRNIEHADLLVVKKGEKVTVEVPVVLTGIAGPGALVVNEVSTIKLEADALNIPEEISVSIESAPIGTQILAGGVELPAGATLQDDPELLLVNIVEAAAQASAEEATDETEGEAEEA
ncbi:50S ribosomal protein L25/general stress protein Ctc [Rhodococcus sp. HNM0563]|uniref:50S ribosomal protein L25/general stress protein Ctc n=1 Tax=unclassified Rhodococcus (in: high G+C Gram-positive bacteria) TaxID=192944 RepID=UPI00146A3DE0|nr:MULTISPECIES: 50S ribosomal protein L25/general stress protein Ctc [unclassified Rhodococcus (in: high G+C Gram-positive bacteria)]MCK0089677.1 50S ribosomal protein L25/general stress protein Ctc [Rhodococcus sp. F64268]NLU62387.1 50S ribosomal protein L25/general stress protein Ctc [Rhodococcus sp. HNM0563]